MDTNRLQTGNSPTLPIKKKTSSLEARYKAYEEKLTWITLMQQNERIEYQPFYQELLQLYKRRREDKYVFGLVVFMLKYRGALFMFSKKSFASQLIEILKHARAETPGELSQ